jgi:hypothetical protein
MKYIVRVLRFFCSCLILSTVWIWHGLGETSLYLLKTSNPDQTITLEKLAEISSAYYKETNAQLDLHEACPVTLKTSTGVEFSALFFNRQSDTVLILGQGFPGGKESMLSFAKLFPDYDVIVFDYRWKDLGYALNPLNLLYPLKRWVYNAREEVEAVLAFLENYKHYRQKIGLAECYSTFLFVLAQAQAQRENRKAFDKLILDSCALSLLKFAERISIDPLLPISPRVGGTPEAIQAFLRSRAIRSVMLKLLHALMPQVTVEGYLAEISNVPLLFIHAQNDLMVPLEHFDQIWSAVQHTPKVALITPYRHADNLRHDKKVYRYVCEQFIASLSEQELLKALT